MDDDDNTHLTTKSMIALYEALLPQVETLARDLGPMAQKHPAGLVSPASLASVNRLLVLVRKVVSRLSQAGFVVPLPQGHSVSYADLALVLSLARTALTAFRDFYGEGDIDGSWYWATIED